MKKIILMFVVVACFSTVSFAGIGINWGTDNSWFEIRGSETSGEEGDQLLLQTDVLWQLIFAGANNQIDSIDDLAESEYSAWKSNNYLAGDDVLLQYRIIPQGGGKALGDNTVWDNWGMLAVAEPATVFQNLTWSVPGFAYQRVFESGDPVFGTFYHESMLWALDLAYIGEGMFPTDNLLNNGIEGPVIADKQVGAPPIPEPATMGLLGLGAVVMAIRRRRAK